MRNPPLNLQAPARLTLALVAALALAAPALAGGDDDNGSGPPPVDPGSDLGGLFPSPTLPNGYTTDQSTSPFGVRVMFNMSAASSLRLGQSFRPTHSSIDWAAFVIQNTNQGGAAGASTYRINIAQNINPSTGALINVLGSTDPVSIPLGAQGWFRFEFPASVPLTPGTRYYLAFEHIDGYIGGLNTDTGGTGLGVGGRQNNIYANGTVTHYWDSTFGTVNTTNTNADLNFATGQRPAPLPPCPTDFNSDGVLSPDDLDEFITTYFLPPSENAAADFNADGLVSPDDLDEFITSYFEGC